MSSFRFPDPIRTFQTLKKGTPEVGDRVMLLPDLGDKHYGRCGEITKIHTSGEVDVKLDLKAGQTVNEMRNGLLSNQIGRIPTGESSESDSSSKSD